MLGAFSIGRTFLLMKVVIKVYHILPEICPKRAGKTRKALRKACFIGGDEENRTPLCFGTCAENVREIRLFVLMFSVCPPSADKFCPGFCPKPSDNSPFIWTDIQNSPRSVGGYFCFRRNYLLGNSFSILVKVRSMTWAIFLSSPSMM